MRERDKGQVFKILKPNQKVKENDWLTAFDNDRNLGWLPINSNTSLYLNKTVMEINSSPPHFRFGRPIPHLSNLPEAK